MRREKVYKPLYYNYLDIKDSMKCNNLLTEERLNYYIYQKFVLYLGLIGISKVEIQLYWTLQIFVDCTNNYLSLYEQDIMLFEAIKSNNYIHYFNNFQKYVNDISQKMIMFL